MAKVCSNSMIITVTGKQSIQSKHQYSSTCINLKWWLVYTR